MRLRSSERDAPVTSSALGMGQPEDAGRNWLRPTRLQDTSAGEGPRRLATEHLAAAVPAVADEGSTESFVVLPPDDVRFHPAVIAAFEPDGRVAQSLRALRGVIAAQRHVHDRQIRSLAVLSIGAETEATLTAANLSVVFAQAGYATLLVDANVEQPSVGGLFRTVNRGGLVELLDVSADPRKLVQATAIPTLSILTAGRPAPNTVEMLERQKLGRALMPFEDQFNYVIVDASRAGDRASLMTDGVDAALIVVKQHKSPLGTLQQLVAAVQERGTLVLGTIVAT